jgi:hypothetical protein
MRIRRLVIGAAAGVVSLLLVGAPGSAWLAASEANRLTFSGPVALPGVVLPAGSYTFERASWDRADVIRVLSRDRRHVYFMAFTRLVQRPDGLGTDRLVTFHETPRGAPPRIDTWYPIGLSTGHQFIY